MGSKGAFFFLIKDTLNFCADYNNHIGGKRDYVGERIALAKYLSRWEGIASNTQVEEVATVVPLL